MTKKIERVQIKNLKGLVGMNDANYSHYAILHVDNGSEVETYPAALHAELLDAPFQALLKRVNDKDPNVSRDGDSMMRGFLLALCVAKHGVRARWHIYSREDMPNKYRAFMEKTMEREYTNELRKTVGNTKTETVIDYSEVEREKKTNVK